MIVYYLSEREGKIKYIFFQVSVMGSDINNIENENTGREVKLN